MIHTSYDPKADVLNVRFGPGGAVPDGAPEVAPGVFLEFDTLGQPIALEVTSVRRRTDASTIESAA